MKVASSSGNVNVDPRLGSAILALESGNGRNFCGNNPVGIAEGRASFSSPAVAISSEFGHAGQGHKQVESAVGRGSLLGRGLGLEGPDKAEVAGQRSELPGVLRECLGAGRICERGSAVMQFLTQQGGNPSRLKNSCR